MINISLDVHTHLIPVFPDRLKNIEGVEWRDNKMWIDGHAIVVQNLYNPDRLISWMDKNNVERALVSVPPPTYRSNLAAEDAQIWCNYLNEGLFEVCSEYTNRLIPLPHLPIEHPEISCVNAKGYANRTELGFSIGPGGLLDLSLSDHRFEPLWTILNDHSFFIMIHPGACCDGRLKAYYLENLLGNPHETSVAVAHLIFAGVPARYPSIKFCLSHGGGNVPILAGRWQRGYDSDRPGVNKEFEPPLAALNRFYADSILHNPDALELSASIFGKDHILFGSDWPFPMGLIEVNEQLSETASTTLKEIYESNPRKLFESKQSIS